MGKMVHKTDPVVGDFAKALGLNLEGLTDVTIGFDGQDMMEVKATYYVDSKNLKELSTTVREYNLIEKQTQQGVENE